MRASRLGTDAEPMPIVSDNTATTSSHGVDVHHRSLDADASDFVAHVALELTRIMGHVSRGTAHVKSDHLPKASLRRDGDGTDDTAGTYKTLEDGSATLEKESINQLAARQKKFIEQLEAALVRIQNKTYGICRETGKLIQKERLRAVPHTTLSMEAKMKQY